MRIFGTRTIHTIAAIAAAEDQKRDPCSQGERSHRIGAPKIAREALTLREKFQTDGEFVAKRGVDRGKGLLADIS
jgi:hypothetical protein